MKINELIELDDIQENENFLYEMANLTKKVTGIDPVIFCNQKGGAKHECRVKVSNILGKLTIEDTFTIELKDLSIIGHCKLSSDQLEAVKWWAHKNRFAILDYWKERIETIDFLNRITKL